MRWQDKLKTMPRLTDEQIAAVKEVLDYRLADISCDFPKVDDAHFMIQLDLDGLKP